MPAGPDVDRLATSPAAYLPVWILLFWFLREEENMKLRELGGRSRRSRQLEKNMIKNKTKHYMGLERWLGG